MKSREYKTDRKNLRKRGNTWGFRKDWRDKNGKLCYYTKTLATNSLTIARRRHDEIMSRIDEVKAGADFEWSWEGEYARTTVKERRLDEVVEVYIKHKEAENLALNSIKLIRYSLNNLINHLGSGFRRSTPFFGHMEGNWLVIPADAPYNKSKRELEVCLDSTLHKIWLEMMDVKRDWLDHGKQFDNLTGKITKEFKRAVRECGIKDSHHLHNTRHTFAVREWLRTNNIYMVKKQLGHSSVAVTEGYEEHKRSRIAADHPSLMKQVAEVPKTLDLVVDNQLLTTSDPDRLT